MPKWVADAKIKKKEEEEKKTGANTKPQSSSVKNVNKKANNSTFMGGGAPVKNVKSGTKKGPSEAKKREAAANASKRAAKSTFMGGTETTPVKRATTKTTNNTRLTSNTTAAQRQKMGMPTQQDLQSARASRKALATSVKNSVREATSDENKGFMQRQKSGTLTTSDKKRVEQTNQRRAKVVKNTGAAATKAVRDTVSGYGQTLADVDEMAKSNRNWTTAKAQKMGIDLNDSARVSKVEQERQQSIKEAREFRQELFDKQEQRQAEWDERTKNAKGLEKAWYGAVESGTGMLADTLVGAATGTGQFGALASMGLRTYGPSANQARKEGATDKEARLYGLAQSGKEIATELMFQGAGLAKAAYGKTGLSLADKSANILTKGLTGIKADVVGAGVRALGGTAEENVEELAGWMADPLIKELTYGKAVRNRMKENLRANIPQIGSAADAANVASYFSTPQFTDELTKEYMKSGMSKDKASALAAEMRDYYVAYYSGDKGRLEALEEDLAAKLSGQDKLSLKSWSMDELKDTFASTTLLTLATGLPGAVTTSVKGNQIFDSDEVKAVFGADAVRKVADAVKNTSNKEMSLKAETMKDRLDSGKDLTGTQKYDLYQGYLEKVNETAKKARASYGVVENAREEQDLVPTMGRDRTGNVVYAKRTQQEYNEKFASTELTVEAIKNYMESGNSISDDEARRANAVKKAVADLHVGGLTVGDAHEFAYGNDLAREALKAEEGIDLDRYIVRNADGTVDLAATNEATENALFKINADNAIRASQAETEVFIDDTRGNIDKDLLTRFGNNGQAVWKEVNKDLDPRDLQNYLTNANAASYFYSAGRNTDMSVDTAINRYADTFKTVDNSVLKRAFAAGARDRIIANTPGYGQTVTSGSNIQLKNTKPIITGQLIMDKDVVIPDSDQSAYLALAMSTNTNIHIVSSLQSKQGVEINGMSHGNDIYLNMNAAAESNLGYVFMHEMTHQIKQYAPNEYLALENLVRDRWFNKDAAGMQKAIKDRIDLYSTKGGQQLTEEEAVEEIIADAMAEAMDDPDFAAEVCEQDINLGQAILNSIREALRSIRNMFASTEFKNDRFHNSLLSYLGILDEAEKMWLNALATAKQNKADGLIADWQNRANKQNSPRLSVAEEQTESMETTISDADRKTLNNEGIEELDDGTTARYSVTSWGETNKDKKLKALVAAGHNKEAASKWIDDVNSIASIILDDPERLDYEADRTNKFLKPNGDYYKYTLDASTLCDKRRIYQGTYNAIQHIIPNAPLMQDDVVRIRTLLKNMDHKAPCGICYVESQRKNLGQYAKEWYDSYARKDEIKLADVTTSDGLKELKKTNPEVASDFEKAMAAKGVSSPKVVKLRTDYREDIMRMRPATIEYLNSIGGLRFHSFSDFETPHLIDTMQAVMDMATKNLMGMAYAKVPNFAAVFGPTGIKINLSLIAKTDENGNAVHDENGRLVFDSVEGIPFEEASKWRDAYPDNVAFILVGKDKEHTLEAINDDRVDFVIPFHRSKWSAEDMRRLGLVGYEDFATGHQENGVFVSEFWDYNKTGKENAERYLEVCKEKGVTPIFEQLLKENEDGTYSLKEDGSTDNYWKLLVEGKMYNHFTKKGAPQKPVQPNFNMDEARRVLNEYEGGANTLPVADDVVKAFIKEYKQNHPDAEIADARFSISDTDSDGNILTDGQMEYFKNSQARDEQGRLVPVYHGTFRGPRITIFDGSSDGYWFTSSRDVAEDYTTGYEMGVPGAQVGTERNPYDTDDEYFAKKGIRIEQDADGDWRAIINRNGREHYWGSAESKEELIDNLYTANENEDLFDSQFTLRDYYPVYLNLENPRVIDCNGSMHDDVNGTGMTTRELAAEAKLDGYDGIIFRNVVDPFEAHDVYVAFSSNQVKDINNEDPTENPDIRFSIATRDEVSGYLMQNAESITDIPLQDARLEENRVRYSLDATNFENSIIASWDRRKRNLAEEVQETPLKNELIRLMKQVRKGSGTDRQYSTETIEETIRSIKKMYYFAKGDKAKEFAREAWDAAERIVNDIDYNDELYKQYQGITDYFASYRINLSEDLFDAFGNYKNDDVKEDFEKFIKDNSGKIRFSWDRFSDASDIVELHYAYGKLSKEYPDLFPSDIDNPIDMLLQMDYVLNLTDPYRDAYTSEEHSKLVADIANNLCDIVDEGNEYKATIDDLNIKAMKQRHREAILKVKEIEKQKRDNQIRRAELWKTRYNERIKQDQADKEAGKQKQNEKKLVGDIEKNIKWLSDRLRPETRTKDNAIPEQFRSALAGLLAEFDLQSKGSKKIEKKKGYPSKTTLKLKQLRDQYAAIAKENDDDGNNVFRYNGDLLVKMDELIKTMEGLDKFFDKRYGREVTIADLSLSEMFVIDTMLKSLVHQFREYKNVTIESKRAEIADVSSEVIGDMDTQINRHGAAREGGALGKVSGLLNMAEVTPIYFFKRLGAMYKMYRELRRGFDKYIENDREVIKRLSEIMSGYYNKKNPGTTIESWRTMEDAQTFNFEYGPVTLSVAQMMEVYLYANRPQAFGHMIGDGIIVTPISPVGKIETAKEKLLGHEPMVDPVRLTYENVQEIISKLSEEQVDMANKLQKLVAGYMSDLGNETTMKLYGYKMFDDPNYFGIHVSQTATNSSVDAPAITETIKNFGWTKPLTPGAKNTIVIGDIFTDVARYCNEMNQFNAYAVPVSDFMRVYNYKLRDEDGTLKGSAKSAIIKAFGKQAHTYIMNFLRDLNGASMRRNGGLEGMIDSALGRAKKAAVFMNMRVALQQPTAIVRAFAQINVKYFIGVRPSRKATQEMIEHCPIAQWKAWGFYDTHFGRDVEDLIMNNWSKADVVGSALYGALDNMTWGMIWQAVKKEVEAKQPALDKGSPAYWEACKRRASEVFDSTQVVDSPFHRSDAMRSKDTLVKQFTSFQAEPTLSFNVVRDFVVQAYDAVADGDKSKAVKLIAKGVEIWTLQAAVVAMAQSLWDAVRHKDPDGDDDEDEGFLELWWQNFMADFVDDLKFYNNIYFLKEFTPYAEKLVDYMKTGKWDTYDSNKLLMFQGAEKMTQGLQQFIKKLQKGDEYKHKNGEPYTWYEVMTNFLGGIGYLTGMPIGTVMRDAQSILKWFHINAFAADGTERTRPGLADAVAQKMGYKPIESSSDKKEKTEPANYDAELKDYEESLSDKYTDDQKKKLVKQYQKKLESETTAEYDPDMNVKEHIQEGLTNFEYEMEKRSLKAAENAAGKTGNARNDALWDVIAEGYTKSVESGNMGTIQAMRDAFVANGGDADWFDAKITDKMKSAYKKTVGNDPSEAPGSSARQELMHEYLTNHGVSDEEISEIVRKTYTARDLKAALRIGNEEYIMDELVPLIQAGLTRADFEYLYKYRNYGAKDYDGKYTDPKYTKTTGTFIWPTDGVITSHFGYRNAPTAGASSNHPAIDIGAPKGTPVLAADGGVVIYAGSNGGYGNSVGVKHANGMVTYYNHLSAWNVKVGDQVGQGQQIAQVGSTGISTGPHLDFKILDENGTPVDPEKYLNKR